MSLNDLGAIGYVSVLDSLCDIGVLGTNAGLLGSIGDVSVLRYPWCHR